MSRVFDDRGRGFGAIYRVKDMLLEICIFNSLGLKVKPPMKFTICDKGEIDITHNWIIGGQIRYFEVNNNFLRELK